MQDDDMLSNVTNMTDRNSQSNINLVDNSEKTRWFLVRLVVAMSILGIIACLITREVWIVVASNTPLLVILRYYFPKQGSH